MQVFNFVIGLRFFVRKLLNLSPRHSLGFFQALDLFSGICFGLLQSNNSFLWTSLLDESFLLSTWFPSLAKHGREFLRAKSRVIDALDCEICEPDFV